MIIRVSHSCTTSSFQIFLFRHVLVTYPEKKKLHQLQKSFSLCLSDQLDQRLVAWQHKHPIYCVFSVRQFVFRIPPSLAIGAALVVTKIAICLLSLFCIFRCTLYLAIGCHWSAGYILCSWAEGIRKTISTT